MLVLGLCDKIRVDKKYGTNQPTDIDHNDNFVRVVSSEYRVAQKSRKFPNTVVCKLH